MTPEAQVKHASAFSLMEQFSDFEPVGRDPLGLNGLFTEAAYQRVCLSYVYNPIHKSSKIIVTK